MYGDYGIQLKPRTPESEARMQRSAAAWNRRQCERISTPEATLKRIGEAAVVGPLIPIFPVILPLAWGAPREFMYAASALSAAAVVPFIMKLPMKGAPYSRRLVVGNAILAVMGGVWGYVQGKKIQKKMCKR